MQWKAMDLIDMVQEQEILAPEGLGLMEIVSYFVNRSLLPIPSVWRSSKLVWNTGTFCERDEQQLRGVVICTY